MDEEVSNMVQYQQAYQASSRYFNVLSEMMDTLINSLG
jgi:flagellar hook-associated protein 1 FlgK